MATSAGKVAQQNVGKEGFIVQRPEVAAASNGMEGYVVQVEADVSPGLPSFHMVGYLASEVKEAEERVRTGIRNSGFRLPSMRVTVNLSPANVRKDGTGCDLPVAVAVLASYGVVEPTLLKDSAFLGELGLDGRNQASERRAVYGFGYASGWYAQMLSGRGKYFRRIGSRTDRNYKSKQYRQPGGASELPEQIKTSIRGTEAIEESVYAVDFSEVNG